VPKLRGECSTVFDRRGADVLRVASVPASHIYVRHLAKPGGTDGVHRYLIRCRRMGGRYRAGGGRL
jgi:hypothetical protein